VIPDLHSYFANYLTINTLLINQIDKMLNVLIITERVFVLHVHVFLLYTYSNISTIISRYLAFLL